MMRTSMSLLVVFVLALAGGPALAQPDSGSLLPAVVPAQSGTSTDDPMYQDAPAQTEEVSPQPADTAGSETQESLPATASPLPIAFAIGVLAVGAVAALRTYRLRSPH